VIVSGVDQTLWWLRHSGGSVVVTLAYLMLLFATLRWVLSFRGATFSLALVLGLYSCANKLKLLKLDTPISPFDLTLFPPYLSVARILWGEVALWALYLLLALLLAAIAKYRHAIGRWIRAQGVNWPGAGGCALLAFTLVYVPEFSGDVRAANYRKAIPKLLEQISVTNLNWIPRHNLKVNGQVLSFLFNIRGAFVEPPGDYSRDSILGGLGGLGGLANAASPLESVSARTEATDIVVIMNEAFWDPSQLPAVRISDPLLASLNASSKGWLFSPVFGGYTANAEFEFLTRLSNAYLPSGTIPYTQFIHRPMPSIVTALHSAGYSTTAIHPYERTFYERNRVYHELGFERFIALDDFAAPETAGPFVKDASVGREIATLIDASPQQKHFIFAVTMQNHGLYNDKRYPESSRVRVVPAEAALAPEAIESIQTYSTGVRDAVAFFNSVVRYFEQLKRKAVVVMFGDHLPALGSLAVYRDAGFISSVMSDEWSVQELERMHSVPVAAWTNSENALRMPEKAISPIYLATLVKRAAGVGDGPIDRLLDRMQVEAGALTRFYSRGRAGTESRGAPDTPTTRLYRAVEYDLLFGNQFAASILDGPDGPPD